MHTDTHTRIATQGQRGDVSAGGHTLPAPQKAHGTSALLPCLSSRWRTCSGKSASTPLIASQCSLMHVPTCATAAAGTWGTGWPRRFPPPAPRVPLLRVCFFSEPIFQTRSASSRQILSGTRHIGTMFIITYVFKAWNRKTGCMQHKVSHQRALGHRWAGISCVCYNRATLAAQHGFRHYPHETPCKSAHGS